LKTTASFKLTDTLRRALVPLEPLHAPEVLIYTCGPTVYNEQHIGNYRTFIFEDLLVRALRFHGYQPKRVMNITDVGHLTSDADEGEDKLEIGARREGQTAWEVAKKYEARFLADLVLLGIEVPEPLVRATDTIAEQISFIQGLESQGYTYLTADGVYFDSTKVADYGKLAQLDITGLQEGIRVAVGEKRQKTDFALWKFSKQPGERHMEWESPWGLGFPGWHIECSAIIRKTLGDTIDIHCGGVDHPPVHHTNEIAQSESLTGKPLATIWLHSGFLLVDDGKMSKSLQNVYILADLQTRGADPRAFKLFTYGAHYRSKLNFTWEALAGAEQQLKRLRRYAQEAPAQPSERVDGLVAATLGFLAHDLDAPATLAHLWTQLPGMEPGERAAYLQGVDEVLALDLLKEESELVLPEHIERLASERAAARAAQDWARADAFREQLAEEGYQVLDTAEGQKVVKS
jgi:cysteinyl-tRNA synthetase